MPVHKRMNDPYPREEKRAIFEQIRKDYAQRAALKDDNRKRKEEGRPTRTIVRGVLGFPFLPSTANHHKRISIEQTQIQHLQHLHQILPRNAS
jgi:hypothetical protein